MARKPAATKTEIPAAAEAPAPKVYTLTEKGAALKARDGSKRSEAWALVVEHAGKPDGQAAVHAALKTNPVGAITGTNLFGWARKAGLVA